MRKATFALVCVLFLCGLLAAQVSIYAPIPANRVQVAELLSNAYRAETSMLVRIESPVRLDALVYIESRDGSYHESAPVMHVYGNYLLLKSKLTRTYLAGAKLYQRK